MVADWSDWSVWSEVRKRWVVEDKTGRAWTVLKAAPPLFTISSPGKGEWTGERTGPVKVVSRPEPPAPQQDPNVEMAVAQGLIATKFGGIEVGKQGANKNAPWKTPVSFPDPGSLLAHLRIFHGTTSDEQSLAGLEKDHADLHAPEHKTADFYEPHVHDPDYETL